jgi:threonine dehydratase
MTSSAKAQKEVLPEQPCGAEYLRAVLRAPVYEVAQVTPLQTMTKLSSNELAIPFW